MDIGKKQKRNRLIALSFASVLLVLTYGPLAKWFVAADRFLFDQVSLGIAQPPLRNGLIISIDPKGLSDAQLLDRYGAVVDELQSRRIERIVLPKPPSMSDADELPDWTQQLSTGVTAYVPTGHRLASVARNNGVMVIEPDDDGVFRRSSMWHFREGSMVPSLPLAVAFDTEETAYQPRISGAEDAIYLTDYGELPRMSDVEFINAGVENLRLAEATVFVDADPAIVGAAALLPSGQFVTHSEIVSTLLSGVEQNTAILAPSWILAMQWLAPALIAIVAVLFMPDRNRRDIAVLTVVTAVILLLVQTLMMYVFQLRLDLGRPLIILGGVALLSLWLVVDPKKVTRDAFKRGSDFLAAGRLEPAFAEFRRCDPSESLASVMYKLSLAFEQQAKPERAEAVLEWMKRTHSTIRRETAAKKNGAAPQRLGRYVIEKRLGRGAMGAVYLARDPRINRPVALKVIPIEKEFEDEELKEARLRFFREAESAGRLTHPNIITVYDAGEDKGLAYIAMEFVPGMPLKKFTDPNRLLAPKRALELAASTAEGLDYAHAQGVIHRDIKPANLMYNPKDGSLKISDFGVARLTDNNRTKTGIVLGTPMYMSPEQLAAEDLTGQSDLFSLGVTLYELLIGEVPFKAGNIALLMTKITSEDPPPIANRRAGIPPSVDAVLTKALSKNPENRFSSGAEMAIALRNCARFS
ncbi:MAG: protein kinase [Pseudomonadota bacterium]